MPLENRSRFALTLVVALALMAFGRSLVNGFTYDDFPAIVDNPTVHDLPGVGTVLSDPATHAVVPRVAVYRPLRTIVAAGICAIAGPQPVAFHLFGLTLHVANAILVFFLLRRVLDAGRANVVAALFACHPLLTEVVASAKAIDDGMAAMFVLVSSLCFVHGVGGGSWRSTVLQASLFGLALLAKENAIVLPLLLLVLGRLSPAAELPMARAPFLIVVLAVEAIAFMVVRWLVLRAATANSTDPSLEWLLPTSLAYLPLSWLLFLWPASLSADYSGMPALPLTSPLLLASLLFQALIAFLVWRRGTTRVQLGLAWFYVSALPSLNVLTGYVVFAERFFYLPLIGLAVIAAELFAALEQRFAKAPHLRVTAVAACALALPLASRSLVRTGDWHDNERLFRTAIESPYSSAIMRRFLVTELLRQGRTDEAEKLMAGAPAQLTQSVSSSAERSEIAQRALVALQRSEWREAATLLERVVASSFVQTADWSNYGTALTNLKDYEGARRAFAIVEKAKPGDPRTARMMGRVAIETSDWKEAERQFERSCTATPMHPESWYFRTYAVWRDRGDDAAVECINMATTAGARLAEMVSREPSKWATAGPRLRAALDASK